MGNTTTQNSLIKKMTDMGIPISFINAHPELKNGSWIDPQDVSKYVNLWNQEAPNRATQEAENARQKEVLAGAPSELTSDPAWATMPFDMQEIAIYNYNIQLENDRAQAQAMADALEQAIAEAEPYWQNIIMVAQDEILRKFEQEQGNYDSSVQRQMRIIENAQNDLIANKDFLTLEQQSDLSNIIKTYKNNQENLINSAAGSGLTFSTKRKMAEQRLAEQNQDIVESTNRRYNKQIKDLQENASQITIESQQNIADLGTQLDQNITEIGRQGEATIGTSNLPALPGYSPIGNQVGSIYEQQQSDIQERQDRIYNEFTGSSNLNLT